MDNKVYELNNLKLENIKQDLNNLLNKNVKILVTEGTSKKTPKVTSHLGKLVSISKNLFNIEQVIGGKYKIIKSFNLNDIIINKIQVELDNEE